MKHVGRLEIQQFPGWRRLSGRVPLGFDLELTARCIHDCRHCYINLPAGDGAARGCELDLAGIMRIADEAVALGALWCCITGGEPLLREDFAAIYVGLKKRGLLVSVFTTAVLIGDEHVRLFRKYPPRDIEVTVYGATRETYETVTRRPGSFAAFERGLERLLAGGIKVRLKAMALRSNVHELPAISRFCRERTKDYFRFDPLLHLRFDGDPVRNAEIRNERLSAAEIAAIERADGQRFEALARRCGEPARRNDLLLDCGAGQASFYVSCCGQFRLCSSLCHPDCVYDLRKGTLADAWNHFAPKVLGKQPARKETVEACRRCSIRDLCMWCPAHAYLETGELDSPAPYFCQVAHARAAALEKAAQP